jgi:hypothetical protein
VALLATEPFDFGHGYPLHTDVRQRFANVVQLEWLDQYSEHGLFHRF